MSKTKQQVAHIFHFKGDVFAPDGEELLGYYYRLVDVDGQPMSHLTGPYHTDSEAEEACQRAYAQGDYWLPGRGHKNHR